MLEALVVRDLPGRPIGRKLAHKKMFSFETLFRVLKRMPIQIEHLQNSMSIFLTEGRH